MFLFCTRENAQRKYIDLIKRAATKWPNWDPLRNIRVTIMSSRPLVCYERLTSLVPQQNLGDFGTINKKTGELRLIVEGNIYTHPDIAQMTCCTVPFRQPS